MSLQNHNGAASLGWVGFENYVTTLTSASFWAAHKNTYWLLALELIIGIPGSLLLALMLDRAGKVAKAIYRKAELGQVSLQDFPMLVHANDVLDNGKDAELPWETFTFDHTVN